MFGLFGGVTGFLSAPHGVGTFAEMDAVQRRYREMALWQSTQAERLQILAGSASVKTVDCDGCGAPKRGTCGYCGRP